MNSDFVLPFLPVRDALVYPVWASIRCCCKLMPESHLVHGTCTVWSHVNPPRCSFLFTIKRHIVKVHMESANQWCQQMSTGLQWKQKWPPWKSSRKTPLLAKKITKANCKQTSGWSPRLLGEHPVAWGDKSWTLGGLSPVTSALNIKRTSQQQSDTAVGAWWSELLSRRMWARQSCSSSSSTSDWLWRQNEGSGASESKCGLNQTEVTIDRRSYWKSLQLFRVGQSSSTETWNTHHQHTTRCGLQCCWAQIPRLPW